MGFFSFLEDSGDDEQDVGPQLPVEEQRRQVASKEEGASKLEQDAIRKVHNALREVAKWKNDSTYEDARDPQIYQVKDALDKGILKPAQLVSDVETLLKKKRSFPGLTEELSSGLNDLKVSQQQRSDVKTWSDQLGQAPQISGEELGKHSEKAFEQAKKIREEATNLGVLGRGNKIQEAQNLEKQAAGLKQMSEAQQQKPPQEEEPAPALPTTATPVQDYMKGLGIKKEELIPRIHAAMSAVGITPEEWDDTNVDTRAGILRVLGALDKQGFFGQYLAGQLDAAKKEDAAQQENQKPNQQQQGEGGTSPEMQQLQTRIGQKEAEVKQLYAQLKDNDFMRTWPGIILYVLVGMLTQNPAFAARLIGGRDNRRAVTEEIRGIQMDLRRLDNQLNHREQMERDTRREAVRQLTRERERKEDYEGEVNKMYLNHKLIMERDKLRSGEGSNKHLKGARAALQQDYNDTVQMMRAEAATLDNNFIDDNDPRKIEAKRNYTQLKKEAMFLMQKLRASTETIAPGTYTESGAETENK